MINAISRTMKKWGVVDYEIRPVVAPVKRRDKYCPVSQRPVSVWFRRNHKQVHLQSVECETAHENLERLTFVIETMDLVGRAGCESLMVALYRQLWPAAPTAQPTPTPAVDAGDPYAVLGVGQHYPLAVIEAIWKARLRVEHPDAGGSAATASRLNAAMADIRKRRSS